VFGKEVILQTHGRDKSGDTLADVLLPDGTHVNCTLVKNGWCWWYRKYAPRNTELARLRRMHERRRKAYGWVQLISRRGSGEGEPVEAANGRRAGN
jgi:endonuclease YncB( thermonuclease family)